MDKRASEAHTEPNVEIEESIPSSIEINGKILTGKMKTSLRQEICENRIKLYYEKKLSGCRDETPLTVLYQTIRRFKKLPTGIHKMIHNITPTQQVQFQRGIIQDDICYCCTEHIETIQHIIHCKTRDIKSKDSFVLAVKEKLKMKDSNHDELLIEAFARITLESRIPDDEWPIQAQIGWHRCIRGFMSQEWIEFVSPIKNIKKTPIEILSIIMQCVWNEWHKSWIRRNEDTDEKARYKQQKVEYNNTIFIKTIYKCIQKVRITKDKIFKKNEIEHLKESTENISVWLTLYKETIKAEIDLNNDMIWNEVESSLRENSPFM